MSIGFMSSLALAAAEISVASAPAELSRAPIVEAPIVLEARAAGAPTVEVKTAALDQGTEPGEATAVVGDAIAAEQAVAETVEGDVSVPITPLPDLVYADLSDEDVVSLVFDYIEGVKTLKSRFTQVGASGAVTNGDFYLRRPNQMRFEYAPPTPLLIVASQGNVYVRDEEIETTDQYPIGKTPLRYLLSKKASVRDADIRGVERGEQSVALTFASDDEELEGEVTLIFTAPALELKRWIVRDAQNGLTIVTLDDVVIGEKLSSRLFRAPDAGGTFLKN